MIDWKGKGEEDLEKVDEEEMQEYFSKIFQSEKTTNHPIITDELFQEITRYNVTIPDIDNELTFAEVEYALRNFDNGVGIDGISFDIIHIFP